MEKVEITYLADHPNMISTCASWAYSQWGCQSGGSLNRSIERFTEGTNKEIAPITLVALVNQKPAGMISLWLNDYDKRPNLTPWLASLYVHPFYRHEHIATLLIEKLESEAQRLGYRHCYLVTEEAKNLYAKCGWEEIEQVETYYGNASLMKKNFT